ncbi:hypothetical protein N7540_001104 [Penicillium herquei]|nr:hypothetical protein N7540_001104 [Penicillium herquei]
MVHTLRTGNDVQVGAVEHQPALEPGAELSMAGWRERTPPSHQYSLSLLSLPKRCTIPANLFGFSSELSTKAHCA